MCVSVNGVEFMDVIGRICARIHNFIFGLISNCFVFGGVCRLFFVNKLEKLAGK